MQYFEKTLQVNADDLDDLKHVNNVRYVQWIQDISKAHWEHIVPNSVRNTMVWVVMHHDIEYKGAAKLHDFIKIKTHIAHSKGAISIREVHILDEATNKPLILAKTKWCLLNAETHKPIRIPETIKKAFEEQ